MVITSHFHCEVPGSIPGTVANMIKVDFDLAPGQLILVNESPELMGNQYIDRAFSPYLVVGIRGDHLLVKHVSPWFRSGFVNDPMSFTDRDIGWHVYRYDMKRDTSIIYRYSMECMQHDMNVENKRLQNKFTCLNQLFSLAPL